MSQKETFSMAAAGDIIQTRPLTPYEGTRPEFDNMLKLFRQADVAIGNLEMLVHDYDGYPAATSGGTYMRSPPEILDDLQKIGFDLFSAATNHTFDYSHGGIEATIENLNQRDISYAGIGKTLFEARKPRYVETAAGRIGLVSTCTTFPAGSEAGKQSPALSGRPGLNPLHVSKVHNLPPEEIEQLKRISEAAGIEAVKNDWFERGILYGHDWTDNRFFHFGDMKFEASDENAGIRYQVDEMDLDAFESSIKEADYNADWVIATIHTHQGVEGLSKTSETPDFLVRTARNAIDAGADTVVGHGPHVLRGIELYNGSPIFYSLGNFVVQNETVSRLPPESFERYDIEEHKRVSDVFKKRLYDNSDNPRGDLSDDRFWRTVVPVCEFGPEGVDVRLYPCVLQGDADCPRRGIPVLATDDEADKVLNEVANLSEQFGTKITVSDDTGWVRTSS